MSTPAFCCSAIKPFRPQYLSHEMKFTSFLTWAAFPRESEIGNITNTGGIDASFAIQLVRQVNYGPLESKRYFIPREGTKNVFDEVAEDHLIQANFQKLNTYKNYKCEVHNKFFELNVYQKDPVNRHHWRANLARPAREIDLQPRESPTGTAPSVDDTVFSAASTVDSESTVEPDNDPVDVVPAWRLADVGYNSYDDPMKDFTACDKECGYCGQCDY